MNSLTCFFLSASLFLALGCKNRNFNSEVKHVFDEPVASRHSIQWSAMSLDELKDGLGMESYILDNVVSTSDARAKRVTAMVNAFDARLRRFFPNEMANAPIPQVIVVENEEPNAFVPIRRLCFNVPVQVEGPNVPPGQAEWFVFSPNMSQVHNGGEWCSGKDMGGDVAALQNYIALIQEQESRFGTGVNDCRMSWGGDKVVFRGRDCAATTGGAGRAQGISVPTAGAMVVVYTGFINMLSDNEVKFVLAHELAHYYRAHATAVEARAFYFYERQSKNQAGRPPRTQNPELMALASRILDLSVVPYMPEVPNALFNGVLYKALDNVFFEPAAMPLGAVLGQTATDAAIRQAWSNLKLPAELASTCPEFGYLLAMGMPMSNAAEERCYIKSQEMLLAAADASPLPVAVEGGSIDAQTIYTMLAVPVVRGLSQNEWQQARPATVGDVLRFINRRMGGFYDEFRLREKEALDKKLGFYTAEQEADEWALEQMAAFNLPLDAAMQAVFKPALKAEQMGFIDPREPVLPSVCKAAYEQCWRTLPEVPVGLWHGTHHSTCFRAYNLSQEVAAHCYRM